MPVDQPPEQIPGRYYYDKDTWIQLPATWKGLHALRRDETVSKLPEGTAASQANFTVAMALLENWNLPGLGGNPETWDFGQMSLKLIAWISTVTLTDFNQCWSVKKNYSPASPDG